MKSARDLLLNKMQCHFNWDLEELDNSHAKPILDRFEEKLRDKDLVLETPFINKWTLQLSYSYELFKDNKNRGIEVVEKAIGEAQATDEALFRKYTVSFLHVAHSLHISMLIKSDRKVPNLKEMYNHIKPFDKMDAEEKSGVLGLKTNVLRWYGPDGNKKGLPVIREAILLNPDEVEWKLILVILLNRLRHFNRSRKLCMTDVREPIEVLEKLIKTRDLPLDKRVTSQYLLAMVHKDLIMGDPKSEKSTTSKNKVLQLCREIYRAKATDPMVVSFCAEQLGKGGDTETAITMIEGALEKFPRHIGLNTTACNIYKKQRMYDKAFDCAQIAYEEGGYGAAWLYLESMGKRNRFIDFEWFFDDLIKKNTSGFEVQIHVGAALFYFYARRKIVKGCIHMEKALQLNPTYEGINDTFCYWCRTRVNPLEVTYNQILMALKANSYSDEDVSILNRVQEMIEVLVDVTRMDVSSERDLVEEAMKGRNPFRLSSYRRRSAATP